MEKKKQSSVGPPRSRYIKLQSIYEQASKVVAYLGKS